MSSRVLRAVALTLLAGNVAVACGGDEPDLSAAARVGYDISRSNGCVACHGSNGQGGVGPPHVGLFDTPTGCSTDMKGSHC